MNFHLCFSTLQGAEGGVHEVQGLARLHLSQQFLHLALEGDGLEILHGSLQR